MEHPRNISLYAAPEEAFLVNSFILETEHGIVFIDTQFLVSPAKALWQKIDKRDGSLLIDATSIFYALLSKMTRRSLSDAIILN